MNERMNDYVRRESMRVVLGATHPDCTLSCVGHQVFFYFHHVVNAVMFYFQHNVFSVPFFSLGQNNVATVFQTLGRMLEALDCYENALIIKEESLGEDHPSVSDTLFNLGSVHRKLGHHKEASDYFLRSAMISARARGANHEHTLAAIEQFNEMKNYIS